jgi:hypothetical protein
MRTFELAEFNIARLRAPIDSPWLRDFVDKLDEINALAEESPGFVWRMQSEEGNATSIRPYGDDYLINLSVWRDLDSLFGYVYKTAHAEIMRRRKEWFERSHRTNTVLWWVSAGHRPSIQEAKEALELLRRDGPSEIAFTFTQPYPAPDDANGTTLGQRLETDARCASKRNQ